MQLLPVLQEVHGASPRRQDKVFHPVHITSMMPTGHNYSALAALPKGPEGFTGDQVQLGGMAGVMV